MALEANETMLLSRHQLSKIVLFDTKLQLDARLIFHFCEFSWTFHYSI